MRVSAGAFVALGLLCSFVVGCGRPTSIPVLPENEKNPKLLFARNCAGCHGDNGLKGPGPRLNDPLYMAVVDRETLHDVLERGRPGTAMPAFGKSHGGNLSEEQIQALIAGMENEWARPLDLKGATLPTYSIEKAPKGDAAHGQLAYQKNCMMCHGFGKFKGAAGSVLDPHVMSLISDQYYRTVMIVGRLDWGMPDWQHRIPKHPMSDQEMSDVVAWISSKRPPAVGQGVTPEHPSGTQTPTPTSVPEAGHATSSQEKNQ
jgi:cytochrome c oxidase cbb3-type subunit III